MENSDVWDDTPSSQRKNVRYKARWKVALVHDPAAKIPIFQTLTHDLSLTGTSAQYHSEEEIPTCLTLLLAPPPVNGVSQRIIKLKATVVSSIPFRGGFRLGMTFIQDAELDKLREKFGDYIISEDTLASDPDADDLLTLNF